MASLLVPDNVKIFALTANKKATNALITSLLAQDYKWRYSCINGKIKILTGCKYKRELFYRFVLFFYYYLRFEIRNVLKEKLFNGYTTVL